MQFIDNQESYRPKAEIPVVSKDFQDNQRVFGQDSAEDAWSETSVNYNTFSWQKRELSTKQIFECYLKEKNARASQCRFRLIISATFLTASEFGKKFTRDLMSIFILLNSIKRNGL